MNGVYIDDGPSAPGYGPGHWAPRMFCAATACYLPVWVARSSAEITSGGFGSDAKDDLT